MPVGVRELEALYAAACHAPLPQRVRFWVQCFKGSAPAETPIRDAIHALCRTAAALAGGDGESAEAAGEAADSVLEWMERERALGDEARDARGAFRVSAPAAARTCDQSAAA